MDLRVYPSIASVPDALSAGQEQQVVVEPQSLFQQSDPVANYCIHQIAANSNTRASLCKTYKRSVNAVDCVHTALSLTCLGPGVSGVGLLATVIAAPVVVILEATAMGCGLAGVATKIVTRCLQIKARKHDQIRVAAETKLDTLGDFEPSGCISYTGNGSLLSFLLS